MNPIKTILVATLVLFAGAFALVSAQNADASVRSEASVHRFEDASEIGGSYSQLIRTDGAVAMELATGDLQPLAPYTVWWVVFNTPQGCSDACNEDDIFAADGGMSLNPDAGISILFADGAMSDAEGNASFTAMLPEGRSPGQVAAGPGLTDAANAEVHLVVRTHGELDVERIWAQLTTGETGGPGVADVQFAVHQPASMIASMTAGD